MRVIFLLVAMMCAPPVQAGPWPREKGEVFLSFGQSVGRAGGEETTAYAEYGLGGGWTLGFDATLRSGAALDRSGTLFLRRALLSGATQVSAEIGIGFTETAVASEMTLRPGLGLGRGFARPIPGWMALDLKADLRASGAGFKADATLGLKPNDRLMTILTLEGAHYPGAAATLHVVPSLVWQARPGLNLRVGVRHGIVGASGTALDAGTWIRF